MRHVNACSGVPLSRRMHSDLFRSASLAPGDVYPLNPFALCTSSLISPLFFSSSCRRVRAGTFLARLGSVILALSCFFRFPFFRSGIVPRSVHSVAFARCRRFALDFCGRPYVLSLVRLVSQSPDLCLLALAVLALLGLFLSPFLSLSLSSTCAHPIAAPLPLSRAFPLPPMAFPPLTPAHPSRPLIVQRRVVASLPRLHPLLVRPNLIALSSLPFVSLLRGGFASSPIFILSHIEHARLSGHAWLASLLSRRDGVLTFFNVGGGAILAPPSHISKVGRGKRRRRTCPMETFFHAGTLFADEYQYTQPLGRECGLVSVLFGRGEKRRGSQREAG